MKKVYQLFTILMCTVTFLILAGCSSVKFGGRDSSAGYIPICEKDVQILGSVSVEYSNYGIIGLIPYMLCLLSRKKAGKVFGNLPTLIFLDNEHVHPVRSMDSPKFFLSNVEHNTLFLKVAK